MLPNFNRLVEIALALKPARQCFRSFHVAGIFRKNRLISLGTNERKTHPFAFKNGYPWASFAIHAETLAVIRGKLEDYSGHDLIVCRVDNNLELNLSKPCKYCTNLLSKLHFQNIFYTNEFGDFMRFEI